MSELETSNSGTEEVTQTVEGGDQGAAAGAAAVQEPGNRVRKMAESAMQKIEQGNAKPGAQQAAAPEVNAPAPNQHQAGVAAQQAQAAAQAEAAYKASFKYKAAGQEKEIPEAFRAIIKDEATEKLVREVFEKADGLEFVKQRYQPIIEEHGSLTKGLAVLDGYIEKKQFGKFFDSFGLNDEVILSYAMERLKYLNLPPEQRAKMDAEVAKDEQLEQLQQQTQTAEEKHEQLVAQQRELVMTQVFAHPQINPIIQKYEEGRKPGTFKQKVVEHAILHEVMYNKILTPEDAVISFIQSEGLVPQQAPTQAAAPAQNGQPAPTQAAAPTKANQAPTLPNIQGQGSSPAKSTVTNLNQLKKIRDQALKNAE